mmetsp:Transcript_13254/g.16833  ORF Transcript_13254/g.16833 Transcript_13254/m.16833 type:complete len:83 (+) Transcript_13254:565-813(+)
MRLVFNKLQSLHTQMMHNPFFNFDSHGCFPGVTGTAGKSSTGRNTLLPDEEDDMSDYSSSSCSSSNSNSEQALAPQPPQKPT